MAQVQRKKMLWYYDAIIDWMIANPGRPLSECAAHVGRSQTTLSIIINSDMFKAALATRKEQFRLQHDLGIIEKTTKVANASLDALLSVLETKRDKLPFDQLNSVANTTLERLGYGVKAAQANGPNITVNGNAQVVLPVSSTDLEEARMALRQAQHAKVGVTEPPLTIESSVSSETSGEEPVLEKEEDAVASVSPTS